MNAAAERPPPSCPTRRPSSLPEDPAELAAAFLADAGGDHEEAYKQAMALAIVATELGDEPWQSRARMSALIIRRWVEQNTQPREASGDTAHGRCERVPLTRANRGTFPEVLALPQR